MLREEGMHAPPAFAFSGRAWGSLVVSLLVPGLGSVVNREALRGALYFGGSVAWLFFILIQPLGVYNALRSIVFLTGMGLYVFQMVSAYQAAKRWNRRQGNQR
jgi:hypothetical protein